MMIHVPFVIKRKFYVRLFFLMYENNNEGNNAKTKLAL